MTICVFADAAIAPVLSSIAKFRDEFRLPRRAQALPRRAASGRDS